MQEFALPIVPVLREVYPDHWPEGHSHLLNDCEGVGCVTVPKCCDARLVKVRGFKIPRSHDKPVLDGRSYKASVRNQYKISAVFW